MQASGEEEEPIPLLPRSTSTSQAGPARVQGSSPSDEDATVVNHEEQVHNSRKKGKGKRSLRTARRRIFARDTREPSPNHNKDSLRHALYLLLERPTSSNSAFTLHLVTNTVIVLRYVFICFFVFENDSSKLISISAILTILETLPLFHAVDSSLWFGLETIVVVLFSVEYLARSVAWGFGEPGQWKQWWNWATCKPYSPH
jgi:hypothetical protein